MVATARSTLTAEVRRPAASTGTAVYVPGFLDGLASPAVGAMLDALAATGLTAISFEPRGAVPGTGDPADLGPSVQLVDIAGLIDACPDGRIVLIGHCYGALLGCLAAVADPRVTDVVALMPSRCFIWPEDYDAGKDSWRAAGSRRFGRGPDEVDVPYSVVEDALGHDLPRALGGLRQRILFVAGEFDQLIGVECVAELHAGCGSAVKTFAALPVQHDFRDEPNQIAQVVNAVVTWLGD